MEILNVEHPVGALVQKRWGRIEWWQQDTLAIYLGPITYGSFPEFVKVAYPPRKPEVLRRDEFIVKSK